jgi:glycosyltransferase involved in cell wall biosynthesis
VLRKELRPEDVLTILSLISSEGYYGAENMLVALARNLSLLGCRSIVGVFCDSRFPHTEVGEQARRQGLAVEIVRCNGRWDWNTVAEIRKLLVKHDVDLLHPHGYKSDLYSWAAAWPNRVALLATSHNWPSKLWNMRVYAAIDRLILRRFDKVIVVSEVVSDILRRSGVAPDKVSTISNGVDIERFSRAKPTLRNEIASEDHSLVGFVGRLVPDKGGEFLLRAAQSVLAVRPKTKFVFVGEGPSRKDWETLAAQLGIGHQVIFAGVRDDMPGVYASLDMVVLPSLIESMPMCLLEALAAGKPVIATRVGAIPKLILSEQTGLLIDPADVNGLSAAICRLLTDPELACRLGVSGRSHVSQEFSAQAMAKSYLAQYDQVLAGRRNGMHKQATSETSCR